MRRPEKATRKFKKEKKLPLTTKNETLLKENQN